MLDVRIYFIDESEWVSSIVVTKKNSKTLWLYVEFCNLNKVAVKDPFLAPFIQEI